MEDFNRSWRLNVLCFGVQRNAADCIGRQEMLLLCLRAALKGIAK